LFGEPTSGGNVVGREFDLPELYCACRDLTTAAGVNRALAQVFRLLAQRRISRQEAATFAHLAKLLLRSISEARAESADPIRSGFRIPVESSGESVHPIRMDVPSEQRESRDLSVPAPVNKVEPERGASPKLSPSGDDPISPVSRPTSNLRQSGEAVAAAPDNQQGQTIESNPCTMNTCATFLGNSRKISRSEIAGLKPDQNEHLQKTPIRGRIGVPSPGESVHPIRMDVPSEQRESRDLSVPAPANKVEPEPGNSP